MPYHLILSRSHRDESYAHRQNLSSIYVRPLFRCQYFFDDGMNYYVTNHAVQPRAAVCDVGGNRVVLRDAAGCVRVEPPNEPITEEVLLQIRLNLPDILAGFLTIRIAC